ncbi:DUF1283 family protein [Escherichia coli]|uniref:DUF1283 family protein n=1 Tax=Escherichia coli TaxID=562 RepID=UPI000A19F2FC
MSMNTLFRHLPAFLLPGILILSMSTAVHAESRKLVTESGDNAQSRQHAVMEKEQWNDTRSLRHKINRRAEKEWDKVDAATDLRDRCVRSTDINAYWEPHTSRCLDRRTGRVITP